MRLRTQLVLACIILSVLPLTGIVVYTYHSSRAALEAAYEHEAGRLTDQMDTRLGNIRAELDQRLAQVSALPLQELPGSTSDDANPNPNPVVGNILMTMGETASLLDTLEYLPAPRVAAVPAARLAANGAPAPPAPAAPATPSVPHPAAAPRPHPVPDANGNVAVAEGDIDPDFDIDGGDLESPVRVRLEGLKVDPVVIQLPPRPKVPKFTFTPEQRALMTEVGNLSRELGQRWNTFTPEQRDAKQKELAAKQEQMHKSIEGTRQQFELEMNVAQKAMREHDAVRDRIREEHRRARQREREKTAKSESPLAATIAEEVARAEQAVGTSTPAVTAPVAPAPAVASVKPTPATKSSNVTIKRTLTEEEKAKIAKLNKDAGLLFGKRFNIPVHKKGEVVGQIRANISTEEVVQRVLGTATADRTEVPFALDREGNLYTRTPDDRATLDRLGIPKRIREGKAFNDVENWVVALSEDEESGLRVGVARPVGENLVVLKRTAARNFMYGLALIGLAVIGIVPFANHLTKDVSVVAAGAERIAQGDLMTRLPVHSKNEFGQLAVAFNQMAEDLSHNQQRILEQERDRKEQEMQQRLLSLEYDRKTVELEDARRFQLSMLPKEVPKHDHFSVAVFTRTATEVGGDYYDFHLDGDVLSVTIGDATGHGAKAGTMVTVVKTLFSGYLPSTTPADFLGDAAKKIKRMELGRMAMALTVAQFDGPKMTVASAGMPPVLVHRKESGTVEELALEATPLGTLGVEYAQRETTVAPGDTVLFMTDGFPELQNALGQQLGYGGALDEFVAAAAAPDADGVIAALSTAAAQWHGEQPPNDDITFVVVRIA
jgi:serine phosphatase RsbU (regulator of sigma subunit)